MSGTAAAQTNAAPRRATRRPWDQASEENDLWYGRFVRFVALGPSRSVSLVATGRRNAYPVPAHWPIQAKQMSWRERAKAFDEVAKVSPDVVLEFNILIVEVRERFVGSRYAEERHLFEGILYVVPAADDEDDLPTAGVG